MKKISFILCIVYSMLSFGQMDPLFSSEGFTPIWHNPASFGTWNNFSVNTVGRLQWVGLSDAPQAFLLNTEAKVEFGKSPDDPVFRLSMGVNHFTQYIGSDFVSQTSFPLNKIIHFNNIHLGIGLAPGFQKIHYDQEWIAPQLPDPNLPQSNQTKFSLGSGLMVYGDKFYFGISTTHLLTPFYEELAIKTSRHFYIDGGYRFELKNEHAIFPQLAVKSVDSFILINTMLYYQLKDKKLSFGFGYRHRAALLFAISSTYKGVRLAYHLDYGLSPLKVYSNFSHELRLSFIIPSKD